ncbi:MAG: hypothetical protein NDJ24_03965 [Alphaproteobacteria bacterium]|nr:hypothetical protein [Alphaproteobacteria bacterium]
MRDYYDEMQKGGFHHEKGYAATLGRWIQFTGKGFDYEDDAGWKFKICVAHDDVPKAWNIITDILLENSVPQSATVVTPVLLAQMKAQGSEDKVIVVDTLSTVSPARYMTMMLQIEKNLRGAGVKAAPIPQGEKVVGNSQYLAYGYDLFPHGIYNPEHPAKRSYNPLKHHDPYESFRVDPLPDSSAKEPSSSPREFLYHKWHDANLAKGALAARMPILGMPMDKVQRIMGELLQEGLSPRVRDSKELGGLAIVVEGRDAIRLREINSEVPEFLKLEWQAANVKGGGNVIRVPVNGMTAPEISKLVTSLYARGFKPVSHDSETLGKTIRLTGDDVKKFETLRAQLRPAV